MLHFLEEGVNVATLPTAKTVIKARLRSNMKRGTALIVEGTETLHGSDASVLEGDVLANDVGDVRARLDLFDIGLSNTSRH
jgi:hypothetical protein